MRELIRKENIKFFDLDEQQNPYKPTYTFPEGFDGDLERMENYIRKAASETINDDTGNISTANRDHQIISKRTDQFSSPITEGTKSVSIKKLEVHRHICSLTF
jgi:hypothetical protein